MRFVDQRKKMIQEQIITRGIDDRKVLDAFLKVPRESFVSDEWKEFAYKDHPLQIGCEQTISQPFMVAIMMALLELQETDKVLEIGTGSGYVTALLAEIVSEVCTIERIEELLINAKKVLKEFEYDNIYYKLGDGSLGWVNALPVITEFDKIIVSAGSPNIPHSLLSQLKNGGKLVIPQGAQAHQELVLYEKHDEGIVTHRHGGCVFVPLIGKEGWEA